MKKLLMIASIFLFGIGAISCNNDDDDPINPLVGSWEAKTVSYTINGETHTYPYNVEGGPFAGCDVDILQLNGDKTVVLTEHLKDENDVCQPFLSNGTWTETVVNVKEIDREITSIEGNTLVLKYPLVFYGQSLPITVEYSRQ